ncbi:hypothetical protein DMB66_51330 [Actinoplanes sp. ATCC 53533]|uniref:hypothetical protein n=1 Tax=Actinoplanes sp. ATCC 53533 TaxID=1288362 RepID=UPI000F76A7C0|nr:hypothetical protein [Actinoplanes sp. ATCC 53533]RSM45152.1 hypothetical protein DMB66_51330 [Actinoplanes sp. ATCC 53533]
MDTRAESPIRWASGAASGAWSRLSTVRDADLIAVLARGRVVETGDHGSLIGSGGIYADLFTTQARGYAGDEPPARPDRTAVAR